MKSETWRRLALALFPLSIPVASLWVWHRERIALRLGRPLTVTETEYARSAGVLCPERVRVLSIPRINVFDRPFLNRLLGPLQDAFATTLGITLRYGILLRSDRADDPVLLVHELVHVSQYERYGGIAPFLRRYFHECISDGYHCSALEQEASSISRHICRRDRGT